MIRLAALAVAAWLALPVAVAGGHAWLATGLMFAVAGLVIAAAWRGLAVMESRIKGDTEDA